MLNRMLQTCCLSSSQVQVYPQHLQEKLPDVLNLDLLGDGPVQVVYKRNLGNLQRILSNATDSVIDFQPDEYYVLNDGGHDEISIETAETICRWLDRQPAIIELKDDRNSRIRRAFSFYHDPDIQGKIARLRDALETFRTELEDVLRSQKS